MASHQWSESLLALVTGRLGLLADPMRVRLIGSLEEGEACVQELADRLATTPQNVSRHLGILHRAGIVVRRREGTAAYYSLADYSAGRLLDKALECVTGQIEELADLVKTHA